MEYKDTNYDGDGTVAEELQHALRVRHATPEGLAEATALPAERVSKHLKGEDAPAPAEISRYSAALGLSSEKLLTKAGVDERAASESDQQAVRRAVHALLDEAWDGAGPEERYHLVKYLREMKR